MVGQATALTEILAWNQRIVKLLYSSDLYQIHSYLQHKNKKKPIDASIKTPTGNSFHQGENILNCVI